jgi:hypothetical protein
MLIQGNPHFSLPAVAKVGSCSNKNQQDDKISAKGKSIEQTGKSQQADRYQSG